MFSFALLILLFKKCPSPFYLKGTKNNNQLVSHLTSFYGTETSLNKSSIIDCFAKSFFKIHLFFSLKPAFQYYLLNNFWNQYCPFMAFISGRTAWMRIYLTAPAVSPWSKSQSAVQQIWNHTIRARKNKMFFLWYGLGSKFDLILLPL